jgi:integrase
MVPGDVWDRNGTIFALDLSTALRIEDLLGLRHEHLRWQEYPTRLSVYITDGKTDKFSVGKWTTDFMQSPHNINDGLRRLKMFVASSGKTTGFIFRSQGEEHDPNSHVSYDTMRRTLLNLAGKIGIVDLTVIGWHSCRKTKACLTFQETGKEEAVREVLGHAKKSANYKKYLNRPVGAK